MTYLIYKLHPRLQGNGRPHVQHPRIVAHAAGNRCHLELFPALWASPGEPTDLISTSELPISPRNTPPLRASPKPPPDRPPTVATPTWGQCPSHPTAYEAVKASGTPGKAFHSGPSQRASPVNREDRNAPKTAAILTTKDATMAS